MINVLILGASGGIARVATELFLAKTDARLTLYQRRARRVKPDETTEKGEPFKGGLVSRKSVAALVVKLATSPDLEVRRSLGVSKPE